MSRCSHGVDREWCSLCEERSEIRALGSPTRTGWASARFDSDCPRCSAPIEEGDRIHFDESSEAWVCEDCA